MDRIQKQKAVRRSRIKKGIRNKISGTATKPRLSIFRSNSNIYAQLIDDLKGHTIVSASTLILDKDLSSAKPVEKAREIGKKLASLALENNISNIVFDRNGYLYHGRVKALAEGAREGGLIF